MEMHRLSKRLFVTIAIITAALLSFAACSSDAEKETAAVTMPKEQTAENQAPEEPEKEQPTEAASPEKDSEGTIEGTESREEGPKAEPEEEVIEEDTNVYGNSTGNIYNGGVYAEYEDGKYLMRNREGQVYIIDPVAKGGNYLAGMELYEMNYCNGKLYGILSTQNEQLQVANDQIMIVQIDDESEKVSADTLEGKKPEYMYVVNGRIYYSDSETHRLLCMDPETEEEKVLVDSEVYFPNVYKDRIFFQHDADGESLYSLPLEGGEITKLNDMRSYWPIVYRDRIYYQGLNDAAYTLRCMKLDGSEDQELAEVEFQTPVLCGDKLCFLDASDFSTVSYLDLSNPETGVQKLDIGDDLIHMLMEDEEVISSGTDLSAYTLYEVSNLSYINGCLMFWTVYSDGNGSYIGDNAMYDLEKGEAGLLPYYVDTQGITVN